MTPLILVALTATAAADDTDYRGYVDQAKFFIRKKWFGDALLELEKAAQTDNGRIEPEVWYLLATVRYELGDLVGARTAAERSHSYSRTEDQLDQASNFAAFLREGFGLLKVSSDYEGLGARLEVTLESLLFDPSKQEFLDAAIERLAREKVVLPTVVGLPAGTYLINGREAVVESGGDTLLTLEPSELNTGGAMTRLIRAEAAVGLSHWFGRRVDNLLPTVDLQVGITQPLVGPLTAGLTFDWTPRAYRVHDGSLTLAPAGWALGTRLGVELQPISGLTLRPSLSYRFASIPGIGVDCSGEDAEFSCSVDERREMVIYGTGHAHTPGVEIYGGFLDRQRMSALGLGVKTSIEYAIGRLPQGGTALRTDDGTELTYSTDRAGRSFGLLGLRVLANFDLAF